MQNILLTGGAGFIGSHLADALLAAGNSVTVLDDLSVGQRSNLLHHQSNPRFNLVIGSVLDTGLVERLVEQMDAVYHLAAVVGVRYVVDAPLRGMQVNIGGTESVLKAAARYGVKTLVASSSEVYGRSMQVPFREGDNSVLGPTDIPRWSYALSKLLDEHLAFAYYRQISLPTVAVRYFNAYGPRLDPRGYGSVVARFIMQALSGGPMTLYGDGQQTRSFTYVADTVRGTIAAMETQEAAGQAFNIGNSREATILELALLIRELIGVGVDLLHIPYSEAYGRDFDETRRRCPNTERAQDILGFEAAVDLETGLRQTIAWFKEHANEDLLRRLAAA